MAFKKIAIIGMSGRFPKAEHAKDLDNIFENKIDCIEKISEKRKDTGTAAGRRNGNDGTGRLWKQRK